MINAYNFKIIKLVIRIIYHVPITLFFGSLLIISSIIHVIMTPYWWAIGCGNDQYISKLMLKEFWEAMKW